MCALRRGKHAVYHLKYHFVWIPKYRKRILTEEVAEYVKQVFQRIAEEYDMIIDTMEVVEDHIHIFLEAPPRLSPARIVQILKSISAREVFRQFPHLRRQLWGGEFWSDGYFSLTLDADAINVALDRLKDFSDQVRVVITP